MSRVKRIAFVGLSTLATVSLVAGCGSSSSNDANTTGSSDANKALLASATDAQLAPLAKKEGLVHGFGMPANWANYDEMWKTFSSTYGIQTQYIAEGDMSSGEELQAFLKEKSHPVGDVGDVGLSFGPVGQQMGVTASYKNPYWNQIPDNLKDPNGYWAAAYYGVISFEVNTTKVKDVPHTWADLLKPEYKGMVGFEDPRQSAMALDAVIAAAYANGGDTSNLEPGLQYFKKLHDEGNWTGARAMTSDVATGNVAIAIRWNYLGASDAQQFKGSPQIQVVVPSDSTAAGPYSPVINAYAPHPYAARLLINYLFSDAGQISYAKGGAYPVRLKGLTLPADVHLPQLDMTKVHFLAGDTTAAKNTITSKWGSEVLGQ